VGCRAGWCGYCELFHGCAVWSHWWHLSLLASITLVPQWLIYKFLGFPLQGILTTLFPTTLFSSNSSLLSFILFYNLTSSVQSGTDASQHALRVNTFTTKHVRSTMQYNFPLSIPPPIQIPTTNRGPPSLDPITFSAPGYSNGVYLWQLLSGLVVVDRPHDQVFHRHAWRRTSWCIDVRHSIANSQHGLT
jgi:hypothetical protein